MEYAVLGRTGMMVSPLCFGTIPLGPMRGLPRAEAVALLRLAFDLGVNFLDTAEIYGNYEVIRMALAGRAEEIRISTKSYAHDASGMRVSVERARRELDRDRIDLFLLHEVSSLAGIRGHRGALDQLLEERERGRIGAAGLSTHTIAGVRAACATPGLDVIHPLINREGLGIADGSADEMADAISAAADLGLGVYAMKVLGGGHLGSDASGAIAFVRGLRGVSALAIGIQSREELIYDLACCRGLVPSDEIADSLRGKPRRLLVEDWCRGCGTCAAECPNRAIHLPCYKDDQMRAAVEALFRAADD